jgi:hypothetical protein
VELAIADDRLHMTRATDGWWTADREIRDGERYALHR